MRTLIKNCNIASPGFEIKNGSLFIEDNHIHSIITQGESLPSADHIIDGQGLTAVPGFIDIHCHGRNNCDFADGNADGVNTIGEHKLEEGVTTVLPTTLTLSEEALSDALSAISKYNGKGCRMPAVHLEGPFINPSEVGAQNPNYVRMPDIGMVDRLTRIFPIKKVSFAPELPCGDAFVTSLLAKGITPSAAHSAAKYNEFARCYAKGLRNLTHFCNQMSPIHHRDIGLVGAGLLHDTVYAEMICDKIHTSANMIQLAFKVKGIDHMILITDAMRAAGMPDGPYTLGGLDVIVSNGAARLASNGALAGSILQINTALRNIVEITGLPLCDALKASSLTASYSLGLNNLGRLETGYLADIAMIDNDFNVHKTIVGGELRYEK
ncbi:MAG: N-acetylglucosamine-6-phosphate deacetylase [Bacteroidales bacterium]|nr:N-acetylglucosamine-6-phosphate deacetylase [Candidatus Equibacterium intestinale]